MNQQEILAKLLKRKSELEVAIELVGACGNGDVKVRKSPTAQDRILEILSKEEKPLEIREIWKKGKDLGMANRKSSIRALLSRMNSENKVERITRGTYQIK